MLPAAFFYILNSNVKHVELLHSTPFHTHSKKHRSMYENVTYALFITFYLMP